MAMRTNTYTPQETYRHCIQGRRAHGHGEGGVYCSLLVRNIDGYIEVLFHCDPSTGAELTAAQAHELAAALTETACP